MPNLSASFDRRYTTKLSKQPGIVPSNSQHPEDGLIIRVPGAQCTTTNAANSTSLYCDCNQDFRALYLVSFVDLAAWRLFSSPSKGMVTSTTMALSKDLLITTKSGRFFCGSPGISCSIKIFPRSEGMAFRIRFRISPCRLRIRPMKLRQWLSARANVSG